MTKCSHCLKPENLCVCSLVTPLATQLHTLILQHPQEPGEALSTARLAHLALPSSTLKIGLSWPNLSKALGREAIPSQWAVLYLGSGIQGERKNTSHSVEFVSKRGNPVPPPEKLEGIVILDGTWSQAKALWWRNAWLLKLRRMILQPSQPSLYGKLRREPRKECLSTIESIAETLVALGETPETGEKLRELFSHLLQKQRQRKSPGTTPTQA